MGKECNWSKEEKQILKDNYESDGAEHVIKLLEDKRTKASVYRMANRLKLKRTKRVINGVERVDWSEKEKQILLDNYKTTDTKKVIKLLKNKRTKASIYINANNMDIKKDLKNKEKSSNKMFWTYEEEKILKDNHENKTLGEIYLLLSRKINVETIGQKIRRMGLSIHHTKNWSDYDDSILIKNHNKKTLEEIHELILDKKSVDKIKDRINILKRDGKIVRE